MDSRLRKFRDNSPKGKMQPFLKIFRKKSCRKKQNRWVEPWMTCLWQSYPFLSKSIWRDMLETHRLTWSHLRFRSHFDRNPNTQWTSHSAINLQCCPWDYIWWTILMRDSKFCTRTWTLSNTQWLLLRWCTCIELLWTSRPFSGHGLLMTFQSDFPSH